MSDEHSELESEETAAEILADLKLDREVMALPAIYADAFRTIYWSNHVRLVFGERSVRSGEHWRFAVLLESADVTKLIKRLQSTLRKMETPSLNDT